MPARCRSRQPRSWPRFIVTPSCRSSPSTGTTSAGIETRDMAWPSIWPPFGRSGLAYTTARRFGRSVRADPCHVPDASARSQRGKCGEAHARAWLEGRGLRFVTRNWHCQAGELDLVMIDGDELVFVEVKTRTGDGHGRASEAVGTAKRRRILT